MDCHLHAGRYDVRLLPKTIAWNDGTWHTVDQMPLKGGAAAWEKMHLAILNGWPVLQLWLWDKGGNETEVESLHWIVGDLIPERAFNPVAEGIVRKRRQEPVDPPPEEGAPVQPAKKPRFLYDTWETFKLSAGSKGTLVWELAGNKKIIEREKLENAPPVSTGVETTSGAEKKSVSP